MPAEIRDQDRLRVVLVSPRNPLNIGAAARAMSNFGFFDLRLVNAYDVAYREARSAVGAAALLESAKVCTSVAEAVDGCSLVVGTTAAGRRELHHSLRRLEYGARLIKKQWTSGQVALMFGSEKYGLSNDDLSHCDWLVRIPTRTEHSSMNLGQSVAICLYELIRNARAATSEPKLIKTAPAADLERFTAMLEEVLAGAGYLNEKTIASSRNKIRRLVRRMSLNARDAEIWMGMMRQLRWKVTRPE